MISILVIVQNERERQILSLAFQQVQVKVIVSLPNYSNYVKIVQYSPNLILMEIPRISTDQVHFTQLVRKNLRTETMPIIGYGDKTDTNIKKYLLNSGINEYMERPLKFSLLLTSIQKYLSLQKKTLTDVQAIRVNEKEGDINLILDPQTPPPKKTEFMLKHISKFLAFPFTASRVLQLIDSSKSGANELARIIEADPVIASMVLKVSNSVFFASLNRRISSIKDAVVRIGITETKRIVSTMSVMNMFDNRFSHNAGFNRYEFWYHSLATAVIAEHLAKQKNVLVRDEVFLAGLLHDFAIIIMDEFYPAIFEKILAHATDTSGKFCQSFRKILGLSTEDLITRLFDIWKMPQNIITAVENQETILHASSPLTKEGKQVSLCIAMAQIIAKSFCMGKECDQQVEPLEIHHFESIGISNGLRNSFYQSVNHDLSLYRSFLKVEEIKENTRTRKQEIGYVSYIDTNFSPPVEYLKALGHNMVRIKSENPDLAKINNAFDLVCIVGQRGTPIDTSKPFLDLKQRATEDQSPEGKLPLLFIAHPDKSLAEVSLPDNLSLVFNFCDLGQFEENVLKAIAHKQVRQALPEIEEQVSSPVTEVKEEPVKAPSTDNANTVSPPNKAKDAKNEKEK